jgi:pyruvate/2-oxoglutarate/acetoin dehydrogenase E1 component
VIATSETRTIDAIRDALEAALATDPAVCVLGEDVTVGGPFGATKGLSDAYGDRVRNTPISEATVMGLAIGAALSGRRPVVEIMFVDFITLAMDQLVNHAAKFHYMSGGQLRVPLTIRVQGGATGGMGAHHSQSLEGWLAHVPGLKIVVPATPADAGALLTAAIADDNPVVFLEHRGLYWARGPVPGPAASAGDELAADARAAVAHGRVAIRRPGHDVTVVGWSRAVTTALAAADTLVAEDIEVEVVDLRTLVPLDLDGILASVRRTSRLVIVHEAVESGGFDAEIAARVQAVAGDSLRAPIARVGAPFAPVPAAPELEALFVPSAARVAEAVRRTVAADPADRPRPVA